jgi:hypothetical protein
VTTGDRPANCGCLGGARSPPGQSSTYVSDQKYAPKGFLPGSATTSIWWWLTIPLGFIVVIGLIAVIDHRLGRNSV